MERFIRQKYVNTNVSGQGQPQSPRSDEGVPPPLPPKNTSKFGIRSASSLFPLTSRSRKEKALPSPDLHRPSSHGSGSTSKYFGAAVKYDGEDDTESKLSRLRDMGFQDQQRNAIVLRGVNGNLERAIESLVRLGEGGTRSPAPPSATRESSLRATRSMTPLSTEGSASGGGLSLQARSNRDLPPTPSSTSTNPFDAMTTAQPQTAQSTGSLQNHTNSQSYNPFDVSRKQSEPLVGAFQNLDINTTQQQPLFPNRTGGLTPQTQALPPFPQHLVSSTPNNQQAYPNQPSMTYPNPQLQPAQPQQPQQTGYNPFYTYQASPAQQPQLTLNMPQSQRSFANNPFARSPTRIASPTTLGQIPEQSQSSFQTPSSMHSPIGSNNPFFSSPAQTPTYETQTGFIHQQQPQQQYYFQQPRQDKASIMALYGNMNPGLQAQSLPASPLSTQQPMQNTGFADPSNAQITQQHQVAQAQNQGPARSMTQPISPSGNNNPFTNGTSNAAPSADPFSTARHISRESVNLGMDLAWTNGRHSPDAFASLSARHA